MQTEQVAIAAIQIGPRLRPLAEACVVALAGSIKEVGLQSPIAVRYPVESTDADGVVFHGDPVLVAGHHRLAAAKLLGWSRIEAVVLDGDERDARLWEIAENLHRAELTALERSEQIEEWRRLTLEKVAQLGPPSQGQGQAKDAGHRKTAAALGVTKQAVARAGKVASLPAEAKAVAVEVGLDDNQSALLKASDADDQVGELRRLRAEKDAEEARLRDRAATRAIRQAASVEFGDWLLRHAAVREVPMLVDWLEGTVAKEVIAHLRRRIAA